MSKIYAMSLTLVLLFSVGTFATGIGILDQVQQQQLCGDNTVIQCGGIGTATSGNMAQICQGQSATEICGLVGIQNANSMLTQSADACGKCALLSVVQGAIIGGAQEQLAVPCGPVTQGEMLSVNLAQLTKKDNGCGVASGGQGVVSDQNQSVCGTGLTTESQFIGATQCGNVSGECDSSLAQSIINITGTQTQMIN